MDSSVPYPPLYSASLPTQSTTSPPPSISESELKILTRWISLGAPEVVIHADIATTKPDPLVTDEERQFWSFRPPQRSRVPSVTQTLVLWGGEFGRLPMAQMQGSYKNAGRDHGPYGFTSLDGRRRQTRLCLRFDR